MNPRAFASRPNLLGKVQIKMKKLAYSFASVLALVAIFLILPSHAQTGTEVILESFSQTKPNAFAPYSGLIFDPAGNLYGTTYSGGASGSGSVYMLSPVAGGGWTDTVLYSFTGGTDGSQPYYAGVTLDAAGNLYGTTYHGGNLAGCGGTGCGVVFKLSPGSGGSWEESVLYTFKGGKDGSFPRAGVIFDAGGNLYGTTSEGGNLTACSGGCGTAFELTPTVSGPWLETVLHSFNGASDGSSPHAALVFDSAGYLYGTNYWGGTAPVCPAANCGTTFRLASSTSGQWKERVLHAFTNGVDGGNPASNVTFDSAGNLYGTTFQGGHRLPTVPISAAAPSTSSRQPIAERGTEASSVPFPDRTEPTWLPELSSIPPAISTEPRQVALPAMWMAWYLSSRPILRAPGARPSSMVSPELKGMARIPRLASFSTPRGISTARPPTAGLALAEPSSRLSLNCELVETRFAAA